VLGRERFILQHRKENLNIDVFHTEYGQITRGKKKVLNKTAISLTQAPLTLGAIKSPTGSITQYGTGVIYSCVL
jgi:hypothetical protein